MFRSWIFLILWLSWTIIWGIVFSPMLLLSRGHRVILKVGRTWSKVTIFLLENICRITSNIIGLENIPKGPFIVASKHQSAWETIFFLCLFDNPIFIIKQELIKIPIYGWYLDKMLMISIDRKRGGNALKHIRLGVSSAIAQGRPVIIFPEGTRAAISSRVKLKSGIKFLHEQFPDIPIIPISLNSGMHWVNNSIMKKPGVIQVKIYKEFKHKENFLDELEVLIN
jgi:1-acyl-sn-glycerol-3-phosphate acyltransferase